MQPSAALLPLLARASGTAIIDGAGEYSYSALVERVRVWEQFLAEARIGAGSVCALNCSYDVDSIAALLALIHNQCTIVPISDTPAMAESQALRVAQAEWLISATTRERQSTGEVADHPLYDELRKRGHAGLVLFSSGSTGESKGIVHDFEPLLSRHLSGGRAWRTLPILLIDHIGGINTLLTAICRRGCLVIPTKHGIREVCRAIESFRVDLLPASPTFLRMLLFTREAFRHDMTSLRLVTYGAEPMPPEMLVRLCAMLPHARFKQMYGLSEAGILPSHSTSSESVWVELGGDRCEVRVIDGQLEVRTDSAMLGYLNAPTPFTADGWLRTGDAVEADGDRLRILGRSSESISVGGVKIYPAEIEAALESLTGVEEALAFGIPSELVGEVVAVKVLLKTGESAAAFRDRMRRECGAILTRQAMPMRVELAEAGWSGARMKKLRRYRTR